MKTLQANPPKCYGLLYSAESPDCQHCLVNITCPNAQVTQQSAIVQEAINLPKTKGEMILAVCQKYGIPTEYKDKDGNIQTVTEENRHAYGNLDFLLTTKGALSILLMAKLADV